MISLTCRFLPLRRPVLLDRPNNPEEAGLFPVAAAGFAAVVLFVFELPAVEVAPVTLARRLGALGVALELAPALALEPYRP